MIGLSIAGLIVLAVALAAARPLWGFALIFFIRPLVEISRLTGAGLAGRPLAELVGVLIPACLGGILMLRVGGRLWLPPAFAGLALALSLPLLWDGGSGFEFWLRLVTPLALLVFPQGATWGDEDRTRFVRVIFWSVPVVLAGVLLGRHLPGLVPAALEIAGTSTLRMAGLFQVPTMTGYWITIFIVISTYLWFSRRRSRLKVVYLLAAVGLAVPLYLTFSRTAWASCALGVLVWLGLTGRRIALLSLGGVLLVIVLTHVGVSGRLFALDLGGTGRGVLWGPALRVFLDASPLEQFTGVGWGSLGRRIAPYLPAAYPLTGTGITENSLLFLTLGGGVLAGLSYVLFIGFLLRRLWRVNRHGVSADAREFSALGVSMVVVMLVQGMTGDVILSPVLIWYYYAIVGVAVWGAIQKQDLTAARGKAFDEAS